ncbi:MAG TPA: hypothetical protein DCM87_19435 [Planctomycetes bacterium]|nr:hypothetical protein [Planctomycetota bacterium]
MFDINMNRRRYSYLALLLLTPTAAFADGVSPVLNFFHKDTWLAASIVTLVIILLECGLLRWRIKSVRFAGTLWRGSVLNMASSATGSVLLLAFSWDSFFMWDTMSLVLPLFLITLVTEIPLLHVLFKTVPLSWKRAAILGCGINIGSYAAVFVIEIGLLVGWLFYAGHLDKKEAQQWNNPDLLKQGSGLIFSTESSGLQHRLRVCIPPSAQWTTLTNCPSLDPNKWDVEGRTCAFVQWEIGGRKKPNLIVSRLPDFETIMEVSPSMFSDPQFQNWQGITDVAVSPDEKRVAMLFRQTAAVAPKDHSSYFDLGGKCKLIVLDIVSGRETTRATRWVSDHGLCWFSDSRRVLFPAFDDESLYRTTEAEVHGSTSYGIGYARDGRLQRGLYVFDIETGTTSRFADGYDPSLAVVSGTLLVRDQTGVLLVDSSGNTQVRVEPARVGFGDAVVSPSGDMILAEIQRHVPFLPGGRLVVFHKSTPDIRHLLDDGFSYRVDWTIGDGELSNQLLHRAQ